jgi:hypothetical protein
MDEADESMSAQDTLAPVSHGGDEGDTPRASAGERDGDHDGERHAERAAILATHDRYVVEVIEGLNLCPFARRCRESGRLQRVIFDLLAPQPSPERCADALAEISGEHPDVEVVLLTFLTPDGHPWLEAEVFEEHLRALRDAYTARLAAGRGPRYYMVSFHPKPRGDLSRPLTQDSLVPRIRRTPDPVIQCIRADLMDDLRRQAQIAAEARFRAEIERLPPDLRAMLAHAVQSDPELSSEIARNNFTRVGDGQGRAALERLLGELAATRRSAGA